ncbi:MAG TPA: hypothetical protein DIU39_03365 [Flavobacteriales bacterium]|nr:hypothetical protein [Flavobacteriales bacterium]|tara:strand:+ start:16263 stop:16778 length:516 start_codon:yes stop_codon:yes gene_type:complete
MEKAKHCKVCENLDFNIHCGTKCGLTGKKPDFQHKCSKIKFGSALEKVITEIAVENKLIDKEKVNYISSFFIYLFISIGFIAGGILLTQKLFGYGLFHTVTLVIIGIGALILPKSFGYLYAYNRKNKVAKKKLKELKELLKIYRLDYETNIDIENIHGINEVKAQVKVFRS